MKFYENKKLVETLKPNEAIKRCLKCSYCYHNEDGTHDCIREPWNIEKELENEDKDDNQIECRIP